MGRAPGRGLGAGAGVAAGRVAVGAGAFGQARQERGVRLALAPARFGAAQLPGADGGSGDPDRRRHLLVRQVRPLAQLSALPGRGEDGLRVLALAGGRTDVLCHATLPANRRPWAIKYINVY